MFIPDYYEFCARVKTISGHTALEKIPSCLEKLHAKRPMIISDKGVSAAGLIKLVTGAIEGSNVNVQSIIDNVPADSDYKIVNKITKEYRQKNCDAMIAVGGGSPMDTAKGVNILASLGGDNLLDYKGAGAVKKKLKPLIAIPTTAGTGSEVTLVAVIADHEKQVKMSFTSDFLLPDVAILDSRMTKTLPPFITAPTAMDAMTHAIEAYTCLAKNPLSDATALTAIRLISENILNVVKNPDDLEGRLALANGAILAGMAFSNSMVGVIHNLGHATGGVCGAPHGVCMSLLLPYGLEYNFHKIAHLTAELLLPLAGADVYASTKPEDRAEKTISFIRKLNEDLHTATGGRHARFLKEILDRDGNMMVPRKKLPDIARTAMGDGAKVYNPEELDYDDNMMVLEHAWEGTPLGREKVKKGDKKYI